MKEIVLNNMEDIIYSLNSLPNNYIYRGHSDNSWRLSSTLERVLDKEFVAQAQKFENHSLFEFRNKFHLYNHNNIKPNTKLEWLALMQHYGVPTKLLDFTTSPYVAMYFALENSLKNTESSFTIYALDYRNILKRSISYINSKDNKAQLSYDSINEIKDEVFENIIDRYSYEILWVTEPITSNVRLDRQAGSFLIAGNTSSSIENLLSSELYMGIDNFKYCITNRLWNNCYTLLRRMNIDSKTIYGDIEGLSKSIKMFMKAYN